MWFSPIGPGGTNAGWCLMQVYKAGSSPSTIGQNFFWIAPARGDYNVHHLGSHYNEWIAAGPINFKPDWNFVAYVYTNGDRLEKLYSNGVLKGQHTLANSFTIDTAPVSCNKLWLGSRTCSGCYYGRYFNGILDEVRIYNRALSADEIKALYEATK